MRALLLTPLLALTSPALAQAAPYDPAPYDSTIPRELTDFTMRLAGGLFGKGKAPPSKAGGPKRSKG